MGEFPMRPLFTNQKPKEKKKEPKLSRKEVVGLLWIAYHKGFNHENDEDFAKWIDKTVK